MRLRRSGLLVSARCCLGLRGHVSSDHSFAYGEACGSCRGSRLPWVRSAPDRMLRSLASAVRGVADRLAVILNIEGHEVWLNNNPDNAAVSTARFQISHTLLLHPRGHLARDHFARRHGARVAASHARLPSTGDCLACASRTPGINQLARTEAAFGAGYLHECLWHILCSTHENHRRDCAGADNSQSNTTTL